MTGREKIILGLLGAAIAYAGYIYILDPVATPGQGPPVADEKKIAQMVSNAQAIVQSGGLDTLEEYKLRRASENWKSNPFFQSPVGGKGIGLEEEEEIASFTYSGFVQVRGEFFAILNGLEYMPGDTLDAPGYILADIYPDKAVIIRRNDAGEIVDKIVAPLQEDFIPLLAPPYPTQPKGE